MMIIGLLLFALMLAASVTFFASALGPDLPEEWQRPAIISCVIVLFVSFACFVGSLGYVLFG